MSVLCSVCHQSTEEANVCCDGIEYHDECTQCRRAIAGTPMVTGQCKLRQEIFWMEIEACHFYHRMASSVQDPDAKHFFETLSLMERDHAQELNERYHLHYGEEVFQDTGKPLTHPFFYDTSSFANQRDIQALYQSAIHLEKTILNLFLERLESFPEGRERRLFLELAEEEKEHIQMLSEAALKKR